MKTFPPADYLDGGLFLFSYEKYVRQSIHKVKFEQDRNLLRRLAEEVEWLFQEETTGKFIQKFATDAGNFCLHDEHYNNNTTVSNGRSLRPETKPLWCGVPTDPERLRKRGFDIPSVLFAEQAEKFGGIWKPLLCRTRKTLPMYGLRPEERVKNLEDCFAVVGNVRGRTVILVDDIFTTGTTFSAAAAALKKEGASSVRGMAFCSSLENLR